MSFSGIYAAVPTPFSDDEKVAFDKLEKNLEYWNSQPLTGLLVLGTVGEAFYSTREERKEVWKFCESRLHNANKQLIAGTGAQSTSDTIDYLHLAQDSGADAAIILTPSFFRPSQEALIKHYRDIADASSIPVMLYNFPGVTGVDLTSDTIIKLADHPRIIGIKESSANLSKFASVKAACPDFLYFTGIASTLLSFLCLGGAGTFAALSSIAAKPLYAIQKAYEANQLDKARKIQLSLAAMSETIELQYGIPGLKFAMDYMGLYGGTPRRPLQPLCEQGKGEISALLEKFKQSIANM
ncbi:MAG: dihydrodipicolinate synthase family protein [Anaerolineaceae bacterium]